MTPNRERECCPNSLSRDASLDDFAVAIPVDERKPSLVLVSRNTRDVHVYRHRGWSVAVSAPGGLPALQLAHCLIDLPLYGGLVPGELRRCAFVHIGGLFLNGSLG